MNTTVLNPVLGIGFVVLLIVLIIFADRRSRSDGARNVTDKAVKDKADGSYIRPMLWIGIGAGILTVWALTPVVMSFILDHDDISKLGQAGDLFGSINALFSGLALAGVIVAILLQSKELALQRKELKWTREELERSADAQEESHRALQATTHAQTFNVALGLLDSDATVNARSHLWGQRTRLQGDPASKWPTDLKKSADTVIRGFEAVGALVRLELLPSRYLTTTRSENIRQYWDLLQPYVEHIRKERSDPFFGFDFESLNNLAEKHLSDAITGDE